MYYIKEKTKVTRMAKAFCRYKIIKVVQKISLYKISLTISQ